MSQDQIKTASVRIPLFEIVSMGDSTSTEAAIVYKLRKAGIPVRGLLLFSGVESGTLEIFDDTDPPARVFRWTNTPGYVVAS